MDPLTGLLHGSPSHGPHLRTHMCDADPPWSLRVDDGAPLCAVTVVRGAARLEPDHATAVLLRPGDVAVVRGPDPYTITVPDTDADADTDAVPVLLLSGAYRVPSEIGSRLLSALPTLLVRPAAGAGADATLTGLVASELAGDEPGREAALSRLLDLLLVGVLRTWLATPGSGAPAWHRAQSDPVAGPALRLLHENPFHAWTLQELALKVGVSRATLARRFTGAVGEPPAAYLTDWRLALAADLLRDPAKTVTEVARHVGYSSAFALSTAFRRVRGTTPQQFRSDTPRPPTRSTAQPPRTVVLPASQAPVEGAGAWKRSG